MEITRQQLAFAAKKNPEGVIRLAVKVGVLTQGERVEDIAGKVFRALERERVQAFRERFRQEKK
jgi:hypothetical protein